MKKSEDEIFDDFNPIIRSQRKRKNDPKVVQNIVNSILRREDAKEFAQAHMAFMDRYNFRYNEEYEECKIVLSLSSISHQYSILLGQYISSIQYLVRPVYLFRAAQERACPAYPVILQLIFNL